MSRTKSEMTNEDIGRYVQLMKRVGIKKAKEIQKVKIAFRKKLTNG